MSPLSLNFQSGIRPTRSSRCRLNVVRASGSDDGVSSRSLLSIFCPLLNAFSGDLNRLPPQWSEVASSGLASIARLPFGSDAKSPTESPPLSIRIYEFEACPFCRRVREAITDLDLTVDIMPCPKNAFRNRDAVERLGGKLQFPFMVDDNNGMQLYESDEIVRYLYKTYSTSKGPPAGMLETTPLTGWMPTLFRLGRGLNRFDGSSPQPPEQRLQLYNYENNQFSRLVTPTILKRNSLMCDQVREVLCELEIPYTCISAGKGSRNRDRLKDVSGATTVPFLVDPNTKTQIGDSEAIIRYLIDNYSTVRTIRNNS